MGKTKRKRSRSRDATATPSICPSNPFLFPQEGSNDDQYDALLDNLIIFKARGGKVKSCGDDTTDSMEDVTYLVEYLTSATTQSTTFAPTDIALLLLPWSLQHLQLQNATAAAIVWKASSVSLAVLVNAESRSSVAFQKILSQSVLFKLVPKVAAMAAAAATSSDGNEHDATDVCQHHVVMYKMLLDMFRPAMDVACKAVLLPLLDTITTSALAAQQHSVVLETLRWIQSIHLSRKGNPKTTFQLLADRSVLMAFSRCHSLLEDDGRIVVREILCDGLFHSRYHIEGFVALLLKEASVSSSSKSNDLSKCSSKPLLSNDADFTNARQPSLEAKASAFKSYHEELLEAIAVSLSQVDNGDIIVVARIIPVLLRGFFVQSIEWDRQERLSGGKGKKSASGKKKDTLMTIQFQLFVRWTRLLLVQVVSTDASAVALQSLRQMLELVLEFDAYAPSQQDNNGGEQYSFLQIITAQIFKVPTQNDSVMRKELIPDSICCLRLLFQLHHLLLHDRIVEAMSMCLQGCDKTLFSRIVDFLTTIVETYRMLRQQRYIFASILKIVRRSSEETALDEISFLHELLMDSKLASSVAVAVESSPSLEVNEVFRTISDWIVNLCNSTLGDDATNTGKSMDVAVQLSTIATRNVRVDRGTAADVAIACQDFVNGAIRISVESRTAHHEFTSAALTLSGLVLDLHARCIFWLGRNEKLDMPTHISDTLKSASVISTSSNTRLSDGVIFLACHRLKQLHSLIYDLEREEMELSSSEGKSYVLTAEATQLAAFIANEAEPCMDSPLCRGHRWVAVAQNFGSWISYAHRHLVDQFLIWVVSASAQSIAGTLVSRSLSTLGKVEYPAASLGNDPSAHSREQVETAKCLLSDTSFFQHVDVTSRISLVGHSVAADCISLALSSSSTIVSPVGLRHLASPLKEATWRRSSHSELLHLVKDCSEIDFVTRAEVIPLLKSALSSVLIVNGIQCYVSSEVDALDTVDLALRADHACRSLCLSNRDLLPIGISVVSALRLSLVKMMNGVHTQAVHSFLCTSGHIGDVVCGIIISATRLLVKHDLPDSIESQQLISATGQLVERLLASASSSPLDYKTAKIQSTTFSAVRSASRSIIESHALVSFSRRLLQGLRFSEWHTLYPSEDDKVTKHLAAIYGTVWDLAMTLDNPAPSDISDILAPQILIRADSFKDGLLLLADLICAKDVAWLPDTTVLIDEMQRSCIECFSRSQNEWTFSESSWNTVCYLSGRLTLCRPTEKLTSSIVDCLVSIKAVPYSTTLLETSLCHATPCLHGEALQRVIAKLTESVEQVELPSSVGARLRLITLLVRHLKEDDQIRLLSSSGRLILTTALKPMLSRTGDPHWFGNVIAASTLVENLLQRRDIVPLKERDLALIISYTIGVLGPAENAWNTEEHAVVNSAGDDATAVYICMADLLSTMFQRHTKQLYACVPSVISALHCFLRHVMSSQLSLSGHSIAVRGQHFTRLCEHLVGHREIYKKHVIGLVLEFVVGLGQTMSLQRRDSLLPAIYCLLDTMSTFETQQLNAYMDSKAKIQFRTIHQSYQKLHTYKGH